LLGKRRLEAEPHTGFLEFELDFGIALLREHPLQQRGSEALSCRIS
jgi:hypothetical protein